MEEGSRVNKRKPIRLVINRVTRLRTRLRVFLRVQIVYMLVKEKSIWNSRSISISRARTKRKVGF